LRRADWRVFGLTPVAFWKTEKAVCAKSGFPFLDLLAFGLRFALGMTNDAMSQRR
jgi:hypothetical protein